MQRAQDLSVKVDKLNSTDNVAARVLAVDVLTNYERAVMMTPMLFEPDMGVHKFNADSEGISLQGPGEFGIISFGDEATWRARTYMQRRIIDIGKQEDMDGAFYNMYVSGRMTLRVADRNDILFVLIRECLRFNKMRDAREFMNKGLVYAPNSSETHLLNSQILLRENELQKAMAEIDIAKALDPDNEALLVQTGSVYSEMATSSNVPNIDDAIRSVGFYLQALEKKASILRRDRMDYALASFMTGNYPEATRLGMILRGTPEEEPLKKKLTELGEKMGKQDKALEVITYITQ